MIHLQRSASLDGVMNPLFPIEYYIKFFFREYTE